MDLIVALVELSVCGYANLIYKMESLFFTKFSHSGDFP